MTPLHTDPGESFPNLEPNHTLHARENPDGTKVLVVVCPFTYPPPDEEQHFESSWDVEEGENWMVNCLACEEFVNIDEGKPMFDHGCET